MKKWDEYMAEQVNVEKLQRKWLQGVVEKYAEEGISVGGFFTNITEDGLWESISQVDLRVFCALLKGKRKGGKPGRLGAADREALRTSILEALSQQEADLQLLVAHTTTSLARVYREVADLLVSGEIVVGSSGKYVLSKKATKSKNGEKKTKTESAMNP